MKSMNVEFVADPQKKGEFFNRSLRGGQLCYGQNVKEGPEVWLHHVVGRYLRFLLNPKGNLMSLQLFCCFY